MKPLSSQLFLPSQSSGWLTPELRATFDAAFGKLAAPGKCNPDDESPCLDGDPDPAVAARDIRTAAQRNHDAALAMGRMVLASGELGSHRGLPVTIVVTTTLQDLESAAGQAVTGSGTPGPMRDLIRMATAVHHYLAVFDKHTGDLCEADHIIEHARLGPTDIEPPRV